MIQIRPDLRWYTNDIGGVSYANGVVYVGSLGGGETQVTPTTPTMFALDASTGEILWSYASGSSVGRLPGHCEWHGLLGHRLCSP